MRKRIFRNICVLALVSLLLLGVCVVVIVYEESAQDGFEDMQADATYIAAGIETGGTEYLASLKGYPGRITLIAPDGTVLFDDREDPATMDNHASRPEVAEALESGSGQVQRQSDTLGERTLYYAVVLDDGNILRLSMQLSNIFSEVAYYIPWLLLTSLLLVVAAFFTARWQTKRILKPFNELDLDSPFNAEAYEEFSPFLRKISLQKKQIEQAMQELTQQQEEFSAITQNMEEGLLVVDHAGMVLTVNPSAQHILGFAPLPENPTPLLELNRNLLLEQAVKQAVSGRRVEYVLELDKRQYRLVASPAGQENGVQGAVLLLMDDTQRLQAEQTRREFSANVSHELKTPLTSISGYAEIIRDGLVKPEDISLFAGKIHDESARLVALVNDIIRLSHLDEKQPPAQYETVDLLQLARQTAQTLQKPAEETGITLSVGGEETLVSGVPPILSEILFNLMDNGIRYTLSGGRVDVTVGHSNGEPFLRVADTGIGIPPEHQLHIFERFYRVDKSHARESGGTGLGLSIVKRGALFHGGRVELSSEEGKGSVFTVWLPRDVH